MLMQADYGATGLLPSIVGRMSLPILHATTSFAAATLLFAVQPWAAKQLLPHFGGSASVWLTTLLFFQGAVLLGYLYAHVMAGAPRLVHAGLFAFAALALPVGFGEVGSQLPAALQVLGELALGVGVVVVLLSATTPLMHRWLAGDSDRRETFALYAASNAGSLLGLLAYPLLVEPWVGLADQTSVWRGLSVGVAVLLIGAAFQPRLADPHEEKAAGEPGNAGRWFVQAFVPASLLYGFTAFLTREIAAVPLLWVLPLALYLLTFIFAFSESGRRLPDAFHWAGPALLYATALATVVWPASIATLVLHLIAFVLFAAYFHGELSAARPPSTEATRYYLWISFAGVAAGVFNAILAPLSFDAALEYPLTYALALILLPASYATRLSPLTRRLLHGVMMVVLAVAFAIAPGDIGAKVGAASMMGLAFVAALAFPALSHVMLAMFLGAVLSYPGGVEVIERGRSFYSTHVVEEHAIDGKAYLALAVGLTQHGLELRDGPFEPLGYYHPAGPCGDVFSQVLREHDDARIAVVGLGIGSMSLYAGPDDRMTFFELDSEVVRLARSTFRTLSASKGDVDITVADGRRGLAESPGSFDLIVIDAFSSDAIPTHLLTREAFGVYGAKLNPGGLLLLHTSNRYLDIDRVAVGGLESAGWTHRQRRWTPPDDGPAGAWPSSWVVAAPPGGALGSMKDRRDWQTLRSDVVWTDDYSSLLDAIR